MLLLAPPYCRLKGTKSFIQRKLYAVKQYLLKLWNTQSGDWHWLEDKPMPIAGLNRHLWRLSVPSFPFHFLLGVSSVIATLGLLANSVAIIIGAMIIAPLMGPIIGIAYSMVVANRRGALKLCKTPSALRAARSNLQVVRVLLLSNEVV